MEPVPFASTGAQLDLITHLLRDNQLPTKSIKIGACFSSRHELAKILNVDAGLLVRTTLFSVSANEQLFFTIVDGKRTLSERRLSEHLEIEENKIKRIHPRKSPHLLGPINLHNHPRASTAIPLFIIDYNAALHKELLFFAGDRDLLLTVETQHLLNFGLASLASISNSRDEQNLHQKFVIENLREQIAILPETDQDVKSPCISICRFDFESNQCEGCFRTLSEVSRWSRMENIAKRQLLAQLIDRAEHANLK